MMSPGVKDKQRFTMGCFADHVKALFAAFGPTKPLDAV